MAMDLGLDKKDKQTLMNELRETKEYEDIQNKMRAGVILCAQELMNETPHSQLEQFNKDVPNKEDIELALAIVNDYLIKRNLNCTSQTLTDELPQNIFEEGEKQALDLAEKCEKQDNLLSTIVAGATD